MGIDKEGGKTSLKKKKDESSARVPQPSEARSGAVNDARRRDSIRH